MQGGGKYNVECEELRERLKADGVILLVFGGARGEGFEVQVPIAEMLRLPEFLRTIADEIEKDMQHKTLGAIRLGE